MLVGLLLLPFGPVTIAQNILTADAIRTAGDPFGKPAAVRTAIDQLGALGTDDAYTFLAEHITHFYPGGTEVLPSFGEDPPDDWWPCYVALTKLANGRPRRDIRAAKAILNSIDRELSGVDEVLIPRALQSLLGDDRKAGGRARAQVLIRDELRRQSQGLRAENLRLLLRRLDN